MLPFSLDCYCDVSVAAPYSPSANPEKTGLTESLRVLQYKTQIVTYGVLDSTQL